MCWAPPLAPPALPLFSAVFSGAQSGKTRCSSILPEDASGHRVGASSGGVLNPVSVFPGIRPGSRVLPGKATPLLSAPQASCFPTSPGDLLSD